MKSYHPFVPWFLILTGFSYANLNPFNALRKRESGAMSCYYALNIIDFSALCPSTDYPVNDQGLNVLEVLYFAMRSTTIPGDTIYQAQENIICVTHSPGPNVTFTAGAQAGAGPLSAGASVTFTFSLPGPDLGGICIFTEGVPNKPVADNITLAQATDLVYTLIMSPKAGCKTCARIPIHYPNVTDGTNNGGILKVDYKSQDNCIGTCVGPHSFNLATTPTTATTSAATTTSTTTTSTTTTSTITASSAAKRLEVPGNFEGFWVLTIMAIAALLGFSSVTMCVS